MHRVPCGVHSIAQMYPAGTQVAVPGGRWVQAVALPYPGDRLRAAWWVLTGRAEAVIWPDPGDLEAAQGGAEQ